MVREGVAIGSVAEAPDYGLQPLFEVSKVNQYLTELQQKVLVPCLPLFVKGQAAEEADPPKALMKGVRDTPVLSAPQRRFGLAARKMDAPIMIQFSAGGSQFYAGKGLDTRHGFISDNTEFHAAIAGAVAGAYHARAVAEQYGVPVILHTDHCAKRNLLPWFDGLLEADERYFERHGEPLFSSHMLDLSEDTGEPLEENVEICVKYLERMAKINCGLEMELGITGGEEDGVNNEDANPEDLYSKPEDCRCAHRAFPRADEIFQVYDALSKVPNGFFTIAAAFGNVHGVYQPGNVKLEPTILDKASMSVGNPAGIRLPAGPTACRRMMTYDTGKDIREAVDYGVIKMNIDTDTQWTQIGNPDGKDKPNKKYYDPRACIRSAEESTVERMDTPKNVMGPRRGGLPS
eukprot:Skav224146  [mRNA]  locus=scaffold462:357613:369408:- [translate_table: standard]